MHVLTRVCGQTRGGRGRIGSKWQFTGGVKARAAESLTVQGTRASPQTGFLPPGPPGVECGYVNVEGARFAEWRPLALCELSSES